MPFFGTKNIYNHLGSLSICVKLEFVVPTFRILHQFEFNMFIPRVEIFLKHNFKVCLNFHDTE